VGDRLTTRGKQTGFTLLEILVATTLLGVVAMGAARLYTSALAAYHHVSAELDRRGAVSAFVEELRSGPRSHPLRVPGVSGDVQLAVLDAGRRLDMVFADNTLVSYAWHEASHSIIRVVDFVSPETVLSGVTAFAVGCADSGVLLVELEVVDQARPQSSVSVIASLRSRVAPSPCET